MTTPLISVGSESPRPAGYLLLRQRHGINCLPHHVESFVTHGTRHTHSHSVPEKTVEWYPRTYWPGDQDVAHLEFALKREGLHLQLLRALLPRLPSDELAAYIQSKPTSAYARRLWFLYEEFSGQRLKLPDVTQGNYVDLLDPRDYYTGAVGRSSRHRVNNNLLGTLDFSPMARRTKNLKVAEAKPLSSAAAMSSGPFRPNFIPGRSSIFTRRKPSPPTPLSVKRPTISALKILPAPSGKPRNAIIY